MTDAITEAVREGAKCQKKTNIAPAAILCIFLTRFAATYISCTVLFIGCKFSAHLGSRGVCACTSKCVPLLCIPLIGAGMSRLGSTTAAINHGMVAHDA
jgi:hypothetical protein